MTVVEQLWEGKWGLCSSSSLSCLSPSSGCMVCIPCSSFFSYPWWSSPQKLARERKVHYNGWLACHCSFSSPVPLCWVIAKGCIWLGTPRICCRWPSAVPYLCPQGRRELLNAQNGSMEAVCPSAVTVGRVWGREPATSMSRSSNAMCPVDGRRTLVVRWSTAAKLRFSFLFCLLFVKVVVLRQTSLAT